MMDRHELFAKNLKKRLEKAGSLAMENGNDKFDYLSEDCIRYDYFSAIMKAEGRESEDLFLEYPHPNEKYIKQDEKRKSGHKKEIDCVVLKNGAPHEAIEFKYFAEAEGTKPRNMGALFADCYRLLDADLGKIERTVVLVSRNTMHEYIRNNGFEFLFNDKTDKQEYPVKKTFFEERGKTPTIIKEIEGRTYTEYERRGFLIERIWDDGLQDYQKDTKRKPEYVIAVFRVKEAK